MNIIKLQNELKGVPDQALIGYVQNPTGQVPTYLALSELQRRKEMRNSYQAAKPETTVAESLVNESQPQPMQQGIAAMATQQPAPEPAPMPQAPIMPPQGMAHGGTVHYADGGETSMNLDNLPTLNVNTGSNGGGMGSDVLYSINKQAAMSPVLEMLFSKMPQSDRAKFIGSGMGAFFGLQEAPKQEYYTGSGELTSRYAEGGIAGLDIGDMYDEQIYAQGGIVAFDDGGDVKGYAGPEGSYVQADTPTSRIDALYKLLSGAPNKILRGLAESSANVPYGAVRSQFPDLPEDIFHKNVLGGEPGAGLFGASTPVAEQPIAPPTLTADTTTGAKPAAESTKPTVADDPFAALKKTLAAGPTEKPKSMQDYAAEYKQALGEDPTVQSAKDRLKKMEDKAAEQESKSGWMSLAKAGLAMAAGKSPRALQNIAEGATAGVNDYTEAQDRLVKLREKHFELQSQLDRQARAEQVSAVTYGANSKERAEDRAAREKLEKMAMGNQLAIAQLNYGMQKDNKVVANRDKAIDNAMQKAKIIAEQKGISDAADFDAIYQPLLAQELATLGLGGTMATPQQALPQGVKVTRLK